MTSSNDGSRFAFKTVLQWAFAVVKAVLQWAFVFLFLYFLWVAVPESYSRLSKSIHDRVDAVLNAVATAWLWFVVAITVVALVWGFVERHSKNRQ